MAPDEDGLPPLDEDAVPREERCLRLADGSAAPGHLPLVDLRDAGPLHLLRALP
jgi:hypothetical protein